jgi:small subunit ribosomal protein S15e
MADEIDVEAVAALRKKRQFKKFTYRGLELEKLLDLVRSIPSQGG